jgi:multidrug efflux pump subunit AcrA (membrane-fusion protein)
MRKRNASKKSHFTLLITLIFVLFCSIIAYKFFNNKIQIKKEPKKHTEIQKANVNFIEIKFGETSLLQELPAVIVPYKFAEIYPSVDGTIISRLFREGSYVKQGQPLYKIDTNKTIIKSPISGYIGHSSLNDGAKITTPLKEPLAIITQLEQMYAEVKVTTEFLEEIKKHKNLSTTIIIDGKEYEHKGSISQTIIDDLNKTANVYALFPNPEERLTKGQSVTIKFHFPKNETEITVPQNTTEIDADGNTFVYILNQNNTITKQKIEVIAKTSTDYTTKSIENYTLIATDPIFASKILSNAVINPILVSRLNGNIIPNNINEIQQKQVQKSKDQTIESNSITNEETEKAVAVAQIAQKMAEARNSNSIKNTKSSTTKISKKNTQKKIKSKKKQESKKKKSKKKN